MLVEKYIIVGLKDSKDVVTDVVKQNNGYNYNTIIDSVSLIKNPMRDFFVDFDGPFSTKTKAIDRLNMIYGNISDIKYYSILPVMIHVSLQEARYLKLSRLNKKLKRKYF
jgi:predicted phosphoadenosine phosphosulfate sulfurtransferase